MSAAPDIALLLAETRWLGTLARGLCAGGDADDLVQDALLAAVERTPRTDRPLRGWLATVLRHRARDVRRAERARAARERERARHERLAPTVDVVAKAELQQRLVAAVLALEEPYRTSILLRFFDGLPPREIARRMSAPVATVHSRLQRALDQLRARLEAEHGRRRWMLALAPLLRPRAESLFLGVGIVNVSLKVALGAAVVVMAWTWWKWQSAPPMPAADEASARPDPASAASTGGGDAVAALDAADAPRRTRVAPAERAAEEPPAEDAAVLRGRVIDVLGRGIAGLPLGCDTAPETAATSGADGSFAFVPPEGARAITCRDASWSTVLSGSARIDPANIATVLVAPRLDLAGRVVDASGAPLPGAQVDVHLPAHLGAGLGILLDYSLHRAWRATAGPHGEFALRDVPQVPEATLSTTLGGYLPRLDPLPAASDDALRLVLEPPADGAHLVRGVVLDPYGATVAGARVSAGREVARTDARGAFALDLAGEDLLPRLAAVAPGFQPMAFTPPLDAAGRPRWPERVVLQLGATPLAIGGRVVDEHEQPVRGAKVWITDPLMMGIEDGDVLLAETVLGRDDRPFWAFVLTDDAGRFELRGLRDRHYQVRALDPVTLLACAPVEVAAGTTDAELALSGATFPRLRGKVVARDGTPIPGVTVKLQRPALEVEVPGGTRDEWATRESVRTDAQGAFEFERVPRTDIEVFAQGDPIMFANRTLTADIDPEAFVLQADRRLHVQVELSPPIDRADEARILDAEGNAMLLRIMRGDTSFTNRKAAIVDGRTQIISIGEGARSAVLYRAGVEVGRVPLDLALVGVNSVRF